MTRTEVTALNIGDEITWTDPDNSECTRTDTILEIDKSNLFRNVVVIRWPDGSGVEAFIWEIS